MGYLFMLAISILIAFCTHKENKFEPTSLDTKVELNSTNIIKVLKSNINSKNIT